MRDIKFRVWDNIAKKYIDSRYVSISGLGLLHVAKCIIKTCFRPLHTRKNPWFIVEQYTGLRDKNGTEIYEGDILINDTGEPIEYWVVKFADGGFVGECTGVAEQLFELTHLEIAGNIHENPELVEEK
nr:MAG TPA: YopX protein [Caudoviricetes sp.]